MVKGDVEVLLQRHVGSERIAEGQSGVVITETGISVLLEHFSHDIRAVVASSIREYVPGQAQGFFVKLSSTQGFIIQDFPPWLPL